MAKLPREIIDLFNGLVRDLYGPGDGPLIVVSGGIEGAPLCAVVEYPDRRMWRREAQPGEDARSFYERVSREAAQRGGRIRVWGGLPPEPVQPGEPDPSYWRAAH
jgi:hypothetical protein